MASPSGYTKEKVYYGRPFSSLNTSRAIYHAANRLQSFFPDAVATHPACPDHRGVARTALSSRTCPRSLDGSIQTLPNPDLFVLMYIRKEAVLSSQIEGTQSSLQDLLTAEARIFTPNRANDVDEVVNYVSAMNHGLRKLSELPVSVRLIPRNPCRTPSRGAGFSSHAGRVANQPKLDRPCWMRAS